MNYNMQGMTKTIPELFVMLKSTKVEIKKEHQVLMINKTTIFKKRAKEKKGNFKKNGKVNKGIFDIHVIDVYFTSVHSNPRVFDTGSVTKISNSKHELQDEQRLVKGEVTMRVGSDSKVDKITIAHPLYLRD